MDPHRIRHADAAQLAAALGALREHTLAHFAALRQALGRRLEIAYAEEVNPPLWELGHVGWFEEYWISRNTERHHGTAARLEAERAPSWLTGADALYDSSHVAHTRRWHLDLPDAKRTLAFLAHVRERTLVLLREADGSDASLYFFRLALMHEAMHHEAGLMIAQGLGLPVSDAAPAPTGPASTLDVSGAEFTLGRHEGGFAFDNELGEHRVAVHDFRIDTSAVSWRAVLPFIESGAYDDAALWTTEGWAWRRRRLRNPWPRHLERDDHAEHGFVRAAFGRRLALDLDAPALHLSAHEAQAWCRWAARRLPTEHEWTLARAQHGPALRCGEVWEWTASPFAPWPGFAPHPYRDYSMPWFDGRPVLKGGSFATQAFIKHPAYRNFFQPGRNDVFAGFRSCTA